MEVADRAVGTLQKGVTKSGIDGLGFAAARLSNHSQNERPFPPFCMWREAQFETELKKAEDEPLLGNPRLLRRGGHSRFWPGEGEGLQSAIRLKRFPPPSFFDNFPRAAARIFTYRVVEENREGGGHGLALKTPLYILAVCTDVSAWNARGIERRKNKLLSSPSPLKGKE